MRRFRFSVVILSLLLAFGTEAHAEFSWRRCATLLGLNLPAEKSTEYERSVSQEEAKIFLENLKAFPEVRKSRPFLNISHTDYYRRFLLHENVSVARRSSALKEDLISQYLSFYLREMSPEKLKAARNQVIADNLHQHGVPSSDSGRKTLEDISAKNLEELLVSYQSEPEMQLAEEVVGRLKVRFDHFTNLPPTLNQHAIPILSSAELEKVTGLHGLNSKDFNRNVLKNDHNVFFRIRFVNPREDQERSGTEYGAHGLRLKSDFAKQNAWISAYVMRPDDIPLQLRGESFASREEALSRLYRADFTVTDFELLVRETLLRSLNELRVTDYGRFFLYLKVLSGQSKSTSSQKIIEELVFRKLDLPKRFEAKVPIFVERSAIE